MAYPYKNNSTQKKEGSGQKMPASPELQKNTSAQLNPEEMQKVLDENKQLKIMNKNMKVQNAVLEQENATLRELVKVVEEIHTSTEEVEHLMREYKSIAESLQKNFDAWGNNMGEYILDMLYREEKKTLDKMEEKSDRLLVWRKKETERLGKQFDSIAERLTREENRRRKTGWLIAVCHICCAAVFLLWILGSA